MDIIDAMGENKNIEKKIIHEKMNTYWKPALFQRWIQVRCNPAYMFRLIKSFEKMEYFDKELWDRLFAFILQKRNLTTVPYIIYYYEQMIRMNENEKCPFYKKLDDKVKFFKDYIINNKKDWDYDVNERRPLKYEEWIERYSKVTYAQVKEIYRIQLAQKQRKELETRTKLGLPLRLNRDDDFMKYLEKKKGKDVKIGGDEPIPRAETPRNIEVPEEEEKKPRKPNSNSKSQ